MERERERERERETVAAANHSFSNFLNIHHVQALSVEQEVVRITAPHSPDVISVGAHAQQRLTATYLDHPSLVLRLQIPSKQPIGRLQSLKWINLFQTTAHWFGI